MKPVTVWERNPYFLLILGIRWRNLGHWVEWGMYDGWAFALSGSISDTGINWAASFYKLEIEGHWMWRPYASPTEDNE